jgi:hypothetical protein
MITKRVINYVLQAESLLDIVNFGAKMFKHATDGVTLPCMYLFFFSDCSIVYSSAQTWHAEIQFML